MMDGDGDDDNSSDRTGALARLAGGVAAKLKEAGVEQDRPFLPRCTILHAKEGRRLQVGRSFARYRTKDFGTDVIDRIRLIKSESNRSPSSHSSFPAQRQQQGRSSGIYSTLLTINATMADQPLQGKQD